MDKILSRADKHAIGLHLIMIFMHARTLPTREERIEYMIRHEAQGPHGGRARLTRENAEYAADLMERE